MDQNYWRKCIVCKNEINFSTKYYKCSISSCDKKRSPAQFCSVNCWDVHRSIMSHKSAGAEEFHSPTKDKWITEQKYEPTVRMVKQKEAVSSELEPTGDVDLNDILVVASKLKAYVKGKSGLNTSANVMPALSSIIRQECDKAIQKAHRDGRKTLMGRDFS